VGDDRLRDFGEMRTAPRSNRPTSLRLTPRPSPGVGCNPFRPARSRGLGKACGRRRRSRRLPHAFPYSSRAACPPSWNAPPGFAV
jgi:hypothetical protein